MLQTYKRWGWVDVCETENDTLVSVVQLPEPLSNTHTVKKLSCADVNGQGSREVYQTITRCITVFCSQGFIHDSAGSRRLYGMALAKPCKKIGKEMV